MIFRIWDFVKVVALRRSSFSLAKDGPPPLVIEVLSDSTFEADRDLVRGKGRSYVRAGVSEYLALDPTGDFLTEGIRWKRAPIALGNRIRKGAGKAPRSPWPSACKGSGRIY